MALLDLFRCEIEERGVNLVTFEMRGGNNFRKTYLRGVLKELNARLRGGANFLTPCTPTNVLDGKDRQNLKIAHPQYACATHLITHDLMQKP